jgi:hypothetical protein
MPMAVTAPTPVTTTLLLGIVESAIVNAREVALRGFCSASLPIPLAPLDTKPSAKSGSDPARAHAAKAACTLLPIALFVYMTTAAMGETQEWFKLKMQKEE